MMHYSKILRPRRKASPWRPNTRHGSCIRSGPTPRPRWQNLLQQHPDASIFHHVGWLRALHRTYGYEPVVFTASPPNSDLESGLLFCRIRSWVTGNRMVLLPFSDHCAPLGEPDEKFESLLRHLHTARAGQREGLGTSEGTSCRKSWGRRGLWKLRGTPEGFLPAVGSDASASQLASAALRMVQEPTRWDGKCCGPAHRLYGTDSRGCGLDPTFQRQELLQVWLLRRKIPPLWLHTLPALARDSQCEIDRIEDFRSREDGSRSARPSQIKEPLGDGMRIGDLLEISSGTVLRLAPRLETKRRQARLCVYARSPSENYRDPAVPSHRLKCTLN